MENAVLSEGNPGSGKDQGQGRHPCSSGFKKIKKGLKIESSDRTPSMSYHGLTCPSMS